MKNLFRKNNNTNTWILATVAGAITVGVGAYLYFLKNKAQDDNAPADDHRATDYLEARLPKKHKKRTDHHELENLVANN